MEEDLPNWTRKRLQGKSNGGNLIRANMQVVLERGAVHPVSHSQAEPQRGSKGMTVRGICTQHHQVSCPSCTEAAERLLYDAEAAERVIILK